MRQNVALLSQEVLGIRELLNRQTDSGFSRLNRSIDAFERGLTIKFGLMFYAGCGLLIAVMRLWV